MTITPTNVLWAGLAYFWVWLALALVVWGWEALHRGRR